MTRCHICNTQLARADVLMRHLREQHELGAGELLCPHPYCKKSRIGSGFKRREQLRRHLESSGCKARRRINAASQPGPNPITLPESTEGNDSGERTSPNRDRGLGNLEANGSLGSSTFMSDLKRHCKIEEESLEAQERRCEETRQKILHLREVIEMYEKATVEEA